eukprot:scaffold11957_cov146-Skeletonema_menzelii.AAC.1
MPTPTASPASSSDEAGAMTEAVTAHPSSEPASSPAAMNNEDEVTAHHPHDGDVAMDVANNNDSSASPIQPNYSFNEINTGDDAQMTPCEDESAVNPMEDSTSAMKNSESSSAPEQSAISAPTPPKQDGNMEDSDEMVLDDRMEEGILATDEEMKSAKERDAPPSAEQRRRDDNNIDDTLDKLQHSISVAILAFRKDEQCDDNLAKGAGSTKNDDDDGSAYVKLREAAIEAYQTLVEYGASLDLSLDMMSPLNKRRREKLEKIGR